MSSVGLDLSDCCTYLESSKKTERRKRIEELKLLFENQHALELLAKNSDSDRGITWNSVFCSLHRCLIREAECYAEEKVKGKILPGTDKAVKACCGLLTLVLTTANKGTPHLPCDELFSCILQVLETAESDKVILNSVIGETYINLLGLTLSSEQYWGEITAQTWKGIGKLTISILKNLSQEKMKATMLFVLNTILLEGGRLSQLIVKAKYLLYILPDIIEKLISTNYPKVEYSCLQISHTICTQFSKEYRLSVSNFIDKVLPYIMTLSSSRITDSKFKEYISKVLLEMVSIRMVDKTWITQNSSSLLNFCEKELCHICKQKLDLPGLPKIVILSVKLAKKVHSLNSENETYEDPSTKRQRVSTYIGSVLDSLSVYSANPWPWLCYICQLLEKAPELILDEDIQPLFRYFIDTLPHIADPVALQYISRASVLLLNICHARKVSFYEKPMQDLQNTLWSSTLRYVTTPCLIDIGLTLAQDMIPRWMSQESIKNLIDLYVEQKIPVNKNSLNTLVHLSSNGLLASSEVRISLISWCFSGDNYSAEAILCLLLKSKLPSPPRDLSPESILTDTEIFHLLMSFSVVPTPVKNIAEEESSSGVIEDKLACDSFLCRLVENLSSVNSLSGLLTLSTSLCAVQHFLQSHRVSIFKRLDEVLDRTLPGVISRMEDSFRSSRREESLALAKTAGDFFVQLSKLNKTKLIERLLCLFNVLLDILKKQHTNTIGFKNEPSLVKIMEDKQMPCQDNGEICIIDSIFSLLSTFSENERIQAYINIVNFCAASLNLSTLSGLNIAISVINKIITSKHVTLVLMKDIVSLEMKLCKRWFLHYYGTLQIIDVVDGTVEPLFKCDQKGEVKSQIYVILSSFCKQITLRKYGPDIICKLAAFIVHATQKDPRGLNLISTQNGNSSTLLFFMDLLNSPFHEVRIKLTEFLPILFGLQMNQRQDQEEAFNMALKTVNDLFIVKEGKNPEDVKEEGINRTACALKILLGLVCSCYVWRRKALYNLFQLISFKKINESLFAKVHCYLEQSLKIDSAVSLFEQNLDYILWNWYENYKCFQAFPFHFMCFESLTSFLNEYKIIIAPIFLENLDMEGYLAFCDAISMSKSEVAVSCFPEMVACLLPKLARTDLRPAENINEFILQVIDLSTMKSLLTSEIRKVLLSVFMKLNDMDHFIKLCGPAYHQLPSSLPLNIHLNGLNGSLNHLQRTTPKSQQSLLLFLCNEYPGHIHFLMHNLLSNISSATTTENKSLCFLQYITLCDLIATELDGIKKMAGYVIWHAIHALLHLTHTDLSFQASAYLHRFLLRCFPNRSKYVDYCLDDLFPFVSTFAIEDSVTGMVACKIKDLLLENKELLPRISAYLPMEETTACLEEEINFFLQRQNPDYLALDRLSSQLMLRRKELNFLYDKVKSSNCFSDDCSKSAVHQLISKLITLSASSDRNIKTAAARCLGQIGPKNLNTLALQPESNIVPPPLAEKILLLLLPRLVSNDSEISESASAAITELLRTDEGLANLEQMHGIRKVLFTPFIPLSTEKIKCIPREFSPEKLRWASDLKGVGSNSSRGWALWSNGDHSEWIKYVVSQLLAAFNEGVLPLLSQIALKELEVSEELLPYIVDIISCKSEEFPEGLKIVQTNLSYFFKKHFLLRNNVEQCEESGIYLNRKSVQCMINIVNFCRLKSIELREYERVECLNKVNVNYLYVAYAAQFCRAYFTSLLYAELWIESLRSELNSLVPFNVIPLDLVCKTFPEDGQVLLNILWEDYKELGEQDGIVGCARLQLADPNARIRYFREMGYWQQLIGEADLGNQKEALSYGLLMSGHFTCASQLNDCGWDAAWRLSRWDIEQPIAGNEEFSALHYSAIRSALHLKDKNSALIFLKPARDLVLHGLADASLEVAASIYEPLTKLQLINELESWCCDEDLNTDIPDTEWIQAEPILWQRGLLLSNSPFWLLAAKIARNNSSHLVALKLLQHMKVLNMTKELSDQMLAEEAQIHWDSGKHETAKFILRSLLDNVENSILKGKSLLTYGTWMSESKSEGPKTIIEQYFKEAASLLENEEEERLAASECLSKFADTEYQRINRYLNSPEFELKKSQIETFKKNLDVFKSCPVEQQSAEERKSVKIHQCNIENDKTEMDTIKKEHVSFLRLAVREYLYSLQFERTASDKMFRFVSLWLSNNKLSGLRNEVEQLLDSVPSYRFIPVFPQLAVHLTTDSDHFSRTLKKLLFRCCEDHPYQNAWHLLALANAEVDQPQTDSPPLPRVAGATKLVQELFRSKTAGNIFQSLQELALAYISLANLQPPKTCRPGDQKIPKTEQLRQLRDIPHISCASISVPVKKNADYSDIIGIVGFDEIYTLVGGLNCPKKVKCLCTDGKKRDELVKGQDDPRQDALMQQVFSVLNSLLEADKTAAKRKLKIRTYKVVPLTQKSGVIEWCSNTEPIGSYLRIAHAKHRPNDISQSKCRANLEMVVGESTEKKLEMYLHICSKFKPVMRHFFFEKFPMPGDWYEKRLAYTRSVATNSMIGYVMGIGDRHVFNILIDQTTAELIHIDFGISFELGKILPTPETVPFRLTRDIVDGMGITSVEGVFRRCCEETMRVLRKRAEPVVTTLEMLLYDPLCSWSIKPRSNQSQQAIPDMSAAETNKLAERFLQRLKLKLEGREEGEASSVEGQVQNLIQEARDPKNLCRLFRGWQAYL